jgi:hypothetical protein
VIEGLRGEFPGATSWVPRLEKPAISREAVGWALLSALGAAFIVEAVVRIALMASSRPCSRRPNPIPSG